VGLLVKSALLEDIHVEKRDGFLKAAMGKMALREQQLVLDCLSRGSVRSPDKHTRPALKKITGLVTSAREGSEDHLAKVEAREEAKRLAVAKARAEREVKPPPRPTPKPPELLPDRRRSHRNAPEARYARLRPAANLLQKSQSTEATIFRSRSIVRVPSNREGRATAGKRRCRRCIPVVNHVRLEGTNGRLTGPLWCPC